MVTNAWQKKLLRKCYLNNHILSTHFDTANLSSLGKIPDLSDVVATYIKRELFTFPPENWIWEHSRVAAILVPKNI